MIVTKDSFDEVLSYYSDKLKVAIDTETTGLEWAKGDKFFSIIISDGQRTDYFNFHKYNPKQNPEFDLKAVTLTDEHKEQFNAFASSREDRRWYLSNAKFDMHQLANGGISLAGEIFDTAVMGRLLRNDLFQYGLDALGARWCGAGKDDTFKKYLLENKCYVVVDRGGKKKKEKKLLFFKAPLSKIIPYAEQDASLTHKVGTFIEDKLATLDLSHRLEKQPPVCQVMRSEMRVTRTLWGMERRGVRVDIPYVEIAYKHETERAKIASKQFEELTNLEFLDSDARLAAAFKKFDVIPGKTEKGSWSITDDWLETIDLPLARCIQDYRAANKKANTYFKNFLEMSDKDGFLHCDFQQGGTATGRLSCRDPNLQNLARDVKGDPYPVRRAFIPPSEDFCWFMPDYDQIEYRLMISLAGENDLIDQVLGGLDVHTATANMLGVGRHEAKTINFLLIYGGGIAKFAAAVKCSKEEAKAKFQNYFAKLPRVKALVDKIRHVSATRKYTFNWYGRRYVWPDPERVYTRGPNYVIQGGAADVMKLGMVKCDEHLQERKSKLLLSIHDELPFAMHRSELHIAPELSRIMESIYTLGRLPLTVSNEHSWKSLGDKADGYPS